MAKTHIAAGAAQAEPLTEAFLASVNFVLAKEIEGGYVNDPRDPGGETNFGISKRSYPRVNIKELTREEAVAIYHRDYWQAVKAQSMPPMIAVAAFDAAVNQGVSAAARLLQKAAGVTADGQIGPVTLKAIHDADPETLLVEFLGWRLHRYSNTNNAMTYMRGWANRILRLQSFALATFGADPEGGAA
jgi:lysozyme family protein